MIKYKIILDGKKAKISTRTGPVQARKPSQIKQIHQSLCCSSHVAWGRLTDTSRPLAPFLWHVLAWLSLCLRHAVVANKLWYNACSQVVASTQRLVVHLAWW